MTEVRLDRQLLPRTYGAFFGGFDGLTEIQALAIPEILAASNVLLCSPTASGKTEAYAAPAAELAMSRGGPSAAVIVVSPTRALANDLKRRLEGPLQRIGVTFGRYTGEHKERVARQLPTMVITTPEALDSLLARRSEVFSSTRQVILDEIHVLDGRPRGDQLRVLLHRLRRVASAPLQVIAVSATVDRPRELAERYLENPVVIDVSGGRRLLARTFVGRSIQQMVVHLEDLVDHGLRKILIFCRSRNDVEMYAKGLQGLTRFEDRVFAHHGSMAQTGRERTERLFQQATSALCVTTMTLEMGIDIGTVDYVLLAGLPTDVASLLQRAGRGGRRGAVNRVGFAGETAAEQHLFEAMLRLARERRLCSAPSTFRPSVLAQQALVLACSQGWVDAASLAHHIPTDLWGTYGAEALRDLLHHLSDRGLLERSLGQRYVATESVVQRYERGTIHSNISDGPSVQVVDRLTGDVLGTIDEGSSAPGVRIGGLERRVIRNDGDRILTDAGCDDSPSYFRPGVRAPVTHMFARAILESLGMPTNGCWIFEEGPTWRLVHGLGSVGALILADLLGDTASDPTPYTVRLATALEVMPRPGADAGSRFVRRRLRRIETILDAGPHRESVPRAWREISAHRGCGIDDLVAFLSTSRVVPLDRPTSTLRRILQDLW